MFKNIFASALMVAASAGIAAADGDAAKGEKVFRKCQACHAVGEGAENKVGPVLNGLLGRAVAAGEGFDYSDALAAKGAEGVVWDEDTLEAFLEKPRDWAPGTKMSFAGLRKEADRENVIAYLATFQ